MTVFLSAFLIVNTITALMAQQTRQIGIMKAVGGGNSQVFTMYVVLILAFGLAALAIAVPLANSLAKTFGAGMAMLVAAGQVYFRDIKSFLPYALRIWLYASPVLYYASDVPDGLEWVLYANPMAPILTAWSDVLNAGVAPDAADLARGAGWAVTHWRASITGLPVTQTVAAGTPSRNRLSRAQAVGAKCRSAMTPASRRFTSSGKGRRLSPVRRPASTWPTRTPA